MAFRGTSSQKSSALPFVYLRPNTRTSSTHTHTHGRARPQGAQRRERRFFASRCRPYTSMRQPCATHQPRAIHQPSAIHQPRAIHQPHAAHQPCCAIHRPCASCTPATRQPHASNASAMCQPCIGHVFVIIRAYRARCSTKRAPVLCVSLSALYEPFHSRPSIPQTWSPCVDMRSVMQPGMRSRMWLACR